MFGVTVKNDEYVIVEGTAEELHGMRTADTKEQADVLGKNLLYTAFRREFLAMSKEELDTPRAQFLEKQIWGRFSDYEEYIPGSIIAKRKTAL